MSLSDKIFTEMEWIGEGGGIATKDVKEFIKELKKERPMKYSMNEWIDKLAGEKLI